MAFLIFIMAVITGVIPPQSFEVVRDRIGRILADELASQYAQGANPDLNVQNWIERFLPFDVKEVPSVNVMLAEGTYGGQTQIQSDGTYRYYIDCYTRAKSREDDPGDQKAMVKLHRLMGVCRAIIEDPRYKTLGFTPPFIMNRHFESLQVREPNQKDHDVMSNAMGRLILSVKIPEYPGGFVIPGNLQWMQTTVKLDSTDKGYLWIDRNTEQYGGSFDFSFDFTFE